jgi:hypothetical protein
MNPVLRQLRGVLGIGLYRGALQAGVALAAILILEVVDPAQIDHGEGPISVGPRRGLSVVGGEGIPEMLVAVPVGAVSAMVSVAVVRARVRATLRFNHRLPRTISDAGMPDTLLAHEISP